MQQDTSTVSSLLNIQPFATLVDIQPYHLDVTRLISACHPLSSQKFQFQCIAAEGNPTIEQLYHIMPDLTSIHDLFGRDACSDITL